MNTLAKRFGVALGWIGLAIVAASLYGIVNDQITVTISPEYFSVFKRRQFTPVLKRTGLMYASPRIQTLLIGTLATWWFGLFLGIILSVSGMVGRYPPLSTRDYLRVVAGIMLFTLGLSCLFGIVAYIAAPILKPDVVHWHFLRKIHAVRPAFAIGWWHNGAYLGSFVATLGAGLWAQRQRRKQLTGFRPETGSDPAIS